MSKSVQMDLAAKRMLRSTEPTEDRASDRLREKKVKFRGNFQDKLGRKAIGKKTADFVVIFRENVARNRSVLR